MPICVVSKREELARWMDGANASGILSRPLTLNDREVGKGGLLTDTKACQQICGHQNMSILIGRSR